jgi:nucleoside-diphosphate-sugar epimerase
MHLTILRLATLYGEGDPGNVARLMRLIDRGRFIWVGDGSNRKSLMHREDAARACVTAACSPDGGIRIYNVSALVCCVRDLVEGLAVALGRQIRRFRIPPPLAVGLTGVASRIAGGRSLFGTAETALHKWLADDVYDGRRFENAFGFRPRVGLAEGLQREVAWYRNQA